MAGPWEEFQGGPASEGKPWEEFGGNAGKPKDPSLTDRAVYGFKRMVGATRTALTDDPNQVGQILADQNAAAPRQSAAAQRMQQEIKPYQEAASNAEGAADSVKAWGALGFKRAGQFITEPVETVKSMAEQIPNSLPGLAGGVAGAKAGAALGSLAGPVGAAAGTVIGGIAGGLAGGYLTEKGSSIQEQVQKKAAESGVNQADAAGLAGVYQSNQADINQAAALKGVGTAGTDAVLNVLTMGLSGAGRRMLSNEVAATYKAVKAGSMSAADGAKQLALLEARQAAQNTIGSKALRGAGVVAGEMGGEALSEAAGQKLAYGTVEPLEVIDEGLLGFGQGAAMGLASGAVNKLAGTPKAGGIDEQLDALRGAVDATSRQAPEDQAAGFKPQSGPAPSITGTDPASLMRSPIGGMGGAGDGFMDSIRKRKPSEAMGIDPAAGSLSAAAAMAVDTGAHQPLGASIGAYDGATLLQRASEGNKPLQEAMLANDAERTRQAETAIPFDNASEADRRAYEDAFDRPAPTEFLALSADERKSILFGNKEVNDGGQQFKGTKDGDILNGMGAPFKTRFAAAHRARMMGEEWSIAPVADGFVARWKGPANDGSTASGPASTGIGQAPQMPAQPSPGSDQRQQNTAEPAPDTQQSGAQSAQTPVAVQGVGPGSSSGNDTTKPQITAGNNDQTTAGSGAGSLQGAVGKALKAQVDSAEPMTEAHVNAIEAYQSHLTAEAKKSLEAGDMPVFQSGNVTVSIGPSAQKPGMFQATRYNNTGAIGDSQYKTIEQAIRGESLVNSELLEPGVAQKRMADVAKAESAFQDRSRSQPSDPLKGQLANVPKSQEPGAQASQTPSAQGAPQAGAVTVPAVPAVPAGNAGNAVTAAAQPQPVQPQGTTNGPQAQKAVTPEPGRQEAPATVAPRGIIAKAIEARKAKALDRIAKGSAYFGTPDNAQQFIDKSKIGDTHEVKKTGPGRWDVVAKTSPNIDTTAQPVANQAESVQVNDATFESAGLKIYKRNIKSGDQVESRWIIQSPENAEREARGERQIGGDLIVGSREEAVKRAEQEAKNYASEKARKAEIDRQENEAKAAEEARKAANRGKSIVERRADAVLSKEVRDSETGTVMTRAQWVERRVNDGARPSIEMVDKIKPMSRTQFNRASNAEQRAHEAKIKAGGKVPEYSLGDYIVSKTEYDYAQKLIAESATKDQAQSVQVEPPIVQQEPAKRTLKTAILREAGKKLAAQGEADRSRDRNTNTARRARMAAGAEKEAAAREAMGKTMVNLADAIESGNAPALEGITTRAAVETLESSLQSAMADQDRKVPYGERQNLQGRKPTDADIQGATLLRTSWEKASSDVNKLRDAIKGKRGNAAVQTLLNRAPSSELVQALKKLGVSENDIKAGIGWWNMEIIARNDRLARAGIKTDDDLRNALRQYVEFRDGPAKEDPIKAAERALVGQKVGFDYFPTPKAVAERMAEGIKPGMRVLEPSAGNGNLADAAKAKGATVDVVEISDALRKVLEAKGYDIVGRDFMDFTPEVEYDAILMNPPFSNRMDAAHIQRAYGMLKPGGTLSAIAGEGVFFGSDKKAIEFREWLDSIGATVEKLPEGTFQDKTLQATTGTNARMIVIEKAQAKPASVNGRITPEKAGDMKAGDVVVDGKGVEYIALRARFDFIEVAPFVNGKPNVSADTTFYFHLNQATAGAYENRRNDPVYATGRNFYDEQRPEPAKPITRAAAIDDGPAIVLQNRDRSSASSIAQMNSIAANPDYLRAGQSNVMDSGAPIVFGLKPDGAVLGKKQPVADGKGQRTEIQYAVVEAKDLIASHSADGSVIPEYANGVAGKLRAVAGNARTAGITEGYNRKTAGQYRADLEGDAESLGLDLAAIRKMKEPVLVRIMDEKDVTPDIGDRSNIANTSRLSAVEQAATDARRLDLAGLEFSDSGEPTPASVMQFVRSMPTSEQSELVGAGGIPTRQAVDRLMAAVFKQAYGSDELVSLYAQAQDPEARNILNGLAAAAGQMAALKNAGEYDIRGAVTEAAGFAVNARRAGQKLADMLKTPDMMMSDEALVVARFFADNPRSAKAVADGLRDFAEFALAQVDIENANRSQSGMFGEQPTASREQIFRRLNGNQEITPQDRVQRATGPQADGQAAAGTGEAGTARSEAGGGPAEILERPTQEQVIAQQEAAEKAEAANKSQQRAADIAAKREEERKAIAQRSVGAADTFELGGDAIQNLTGQGDVFAMKPAQAKRTNPTQTIKFKNPIVGPSGEKLVSYTWQWKPFEYVDKTGEERAGRLSDWDKSAENVDTGREVVHQFTVENKDGETRIVSAESAIAALGYANKVAEGSAKSAISAAKTLARNKMQLAELESALAAFTSDQVEVNKLALPEVTRGIGGWWSMGDSTVRQTSQLFPNSKPGELLPERMKVLEEGWRSNRLAERGWKFSTENTLKEGIYDTKARIKRAQAKLDSINVKTGRSAAETGLGVANGPVFSRSAKNDDSPNLIIQHNLTAGNLLHADKMGGMAVPSLAVTKVNEPMMNFGEITLLGDRDMADPTQGIRMFGADIYSPRYPAVNYQFTQKSADTLSRELFPGMEATGSRVDWDEVGKRGPAQLENESSAMWAFLKSKGVAPEIVMEKGVPADEVQKLRDAGFAEYFPATPGASVDYQSLMRDEKFQRLATDYFNKDFINAGYGDLVKSFEDQSPGERMNGARELAYKMRDVGAAPKVNQYQTRDALRAQIRGEFREEFDVFVEGLFSKLNATERIFQGLTNSGNRRYTPHTLDNVIAILKKGLRGGESFNYGAGSLRAKFTPQFKSIKAIQDAKSKLITEEQFQAVKDEANNELFAIASMLRRSDTSSGEVETDTAIAIMEDAPRMGLDRAAKQYNVELSDTQRERIGKFLTHLKNMPTQYFEGKMLRSVGLGEFKAAVVPDGVRKDVLDVLGREGVKVYTYKNGDSADRKRAVMEAANELPDMLFSRAGSSPFYSELARQIEAANINTAPVIGWKAALKGLQSKGVKADEITWSGIEEWLDLQTGKVTKAQVLDYLAANGVQVEETVLGQPDEADIEALLNDEAGEGMSRDEAIEYLNNDEGATPPKFNDRNLVLPGGTNYREVLLTLPRMTGKQATPRRVVFDKYKQRLDALYKIAQSGYGEEAKNALDQYYALQKERDDKATAVAGEAPDYKSGHWEQKNVLAHLRVNDRTDADGKRVLFVEEIQSDWGQAGKKNGFVEKDPVFTATRKGNWYPGDASMGKYEVFADGVTRGFFKAANEEYAIAEARGSMRDMSNRVPVAPFVDKTDKWLTLALKRIIKMAVDGGYDKVAFVNGQQSADRYDLSKQVDSISVFQREGEGGDYRISVYPKGSNRPMDGMRDKRMTAAELADNIGKELADKIVRGEGGRETSDGRTWFSGIDLKVGGEGMKTFYDQIVPNATKALLKKLGGELGSVTIETDPIRGDIPGETPISDDGLVPRTQPGFAITDTLREKASGGLPLFRRQLAKFSRGAQQQANTAVQSTVDKLTADWQNKPEIVIAFDMQDEAIPENVRLEDAKQRSGGAFGNPEGFYYRGVVYLLSSQLATDADVARVLAHESLGHYGLRGLYGRALKPILQQVVTMRRADVIAVARQRGLVKVDGNNRPIVDVKTATNAQVWAAMTDSHKSQSAEEVLAEMAQTTPQAGFVKRAIAAIRQWLRERGFNLKLTDNDIIVSYILPARGWVERGPGGGGPKGGISFARGAQSKNAENTRYARGWYDRFVRLLPDSYRNDPYRREPIAAEDRDVLRDAQVRIDALNKELRGPHDRKGHGPVTLDKLGNLQVDVRVSPYWDITGKIKDLADQLDLGIVVTGANRHITPKFHEAGFESEISLAAIADRLTGVREKISDEKSVYAVPAFGTILSYKPRGFPMALFSRAVANDPANPDIRFSRQRATWTDDRIALLMSKYAYTMDDARTKAYAGMVRPDDFLAATTTDGDRSRIEAESQPLDAGMLRGEIQEIGLYGKLVGGRFITDGHEGRHRMMALRDAGVAEVPVTFIVGTTNGAAPLNGIRVQPQDWGGGLVARSGFVSGELTPVSWAHRGALKDRFGADAEVMFSRAATARDMKQKASEFVNDYLAAPGKLDAWSKTVGTQYHLAQRQPAFKPVYEAIQAFIGDVSYYATEAANKAPSLLPRLETWRDAFKSPVSGKDAKAVSGPIFEGTLNWTRDENGQPVEADDVQSAGIVWTDEELKDRFDMSGGQIKLYREFRESVDDSLSSLAKSHMLYLAGKDAADLKNAVMEAATVAEASQMLQDRMAEVAANGSANEAAAASATGAKIIETEQQTQRLIQRGYAPLTRFGNHTLDVLVDGERQYFGLFESAKAAAEKERELRVKYPDAEITRGTMSEQSYKLFAGVTPETAELFGEMMGVDDKEAFQEYIKLAKSTRSAMKRMIQREGIAGFSEDAGRVLAGFVYSNARQTARNLHVGDMDRAASAIPKEQGELKDHAINLVQYIKNPTDEAQAVRGLLFAQYIGGSVASAMVNMTQPFTMSLPWLSQFGGLAKAGKQMAAAVKDVGKHAKLEPALAAAMKRAEEDGTVSPQEVFDLMKQAQGKASLTSGDGTASSEARAMVNNLATRVGFGWGKMFSAAEQFNRRVTFIAAYRTAVERGMADPDAFARQAIHETQGVYNRGNRPQWARGAIGGTLFTFKQYSISYMEMLHRMATRGKPGSPERAEGMRAIAYSIGILILLSGVGGAPGADDLDDLLSGLGQAMGYNFDSRSARRKYLTELFGDDWARFVERGVSGLPGAPIDVSGRMGLGNLIPGTGLLTRKEDHTRDVLEIAGPVGDLSARAFEAAGKLVRGEVAGAATTIAPRAAANLVQAGDMMATGMYRDRTGKKVVSTDTGDALAKAIGFQPNAVKRVQDSTIEVQRMIGLNKLRESEIADKWAMGLFEKDQDKVKEARDELAKWNEDNPSTPIRIQFNQIMSRLKKMNQSKTERIAKTSPVEIRQQVREALAQ